jgi:hypothetical protein
MMNLVDVARIASERWIVEREASETATLILATAPQAGPGGLQLDDYDPLYETEGNAGDPTSPTTTSPAILLDVLSIQPRQRLAP